MAFNNIISISIETCLALKSDLLVLIRVVVEIWWYCVRVVLIAQDHQGKFLQHALSLYAHHAPVVF